MSLADIHLFFNESTIRLILLAAFLGMLHNRIRGGLISGAFGQYDENGDPLNLKSKLLGKIGRPLNAIVFGAFMAVVASASPSFNDGLWYALAMFSGSLLGWGEYIGAIIHRAIKGSGDEIADIDEEIAFLKDRPVLWGIAGLTGRGILWGACIALATHSVLPLIGGATMGVVYWVAIEICGVWYKKKRPGEYEARLEGWEFGEILYGAPLWAFSAVAASGLVSLCVNP